MILEPLQKFLPSNISSMQRSGILTSVLLLGLQWLDSVNVASRTGMKQWCSSKFICTAGITFLSHKVFDNIKFSISTGKEK